LLLVDVDVGELSDSEVDGRGQKGSRRWVTTTTTTTTTTCFHVLCCSAGRLFRRSLQVEPGRPTTNPCELLVPHLTGWIYALPVN